MRPTKIVIIGAASADFGPGVIADVLTNPEMKGSALVLVDIDADALSLIHALAQRMNDEWASGVTIESTVDQKQALPGAEFVIVTLEVEREKRWRMDYEIPLKHGLRQPLAENGGPGAFAHAARNIAPVMAICEDMRKLCPDAWFFNFTNPVPRITRTAHKYGRVKAAGFCHGIGMGLDNVSELLDIPCEDLDMKAAGINHFTWVLDIRRESTGEDLYPAVRELLDRWPKDADLLSRDLLQHFGLLPVIGGSHAAEYLAWVCDPRSEPWEKYRLHLYDWDRAEKSRDAQWRLIERQIAGDEPIDQYRHGSGERAIAVVEAIVSNANSYELALNIPNDGCIANLPQNSIVEVPGVVSAMGIRGLGVGDLPEPIAELCRRQTTVAELAVEAAVTGDRKAALQALLLDPMITDIAQAQAILDDYLTAHAELLPQFQP